MVKRVKRRDWLPATIAHHLISHEGSTLLSTTWRPPPRSRTPGASDCGPANPSKIVSLGGTLIWTTRSAALPKEGSKAESILDCNGPLGGTSVQYAPNLFSGSLKTLYKSLGAASVRPV